MSKRIRYSIDGTLIYRVWIGSNSRNTYSLAEEAELDGGWLENGVSSHGTSTAWNFPAPVTIDRIGWKSPGATSIDFEVSSNSNDGIDGDWTAVSAQANYTDINFVTHFDIDTPTEGTWFRVTHSGVNWIRSYFLYGEYTSNPRFEFWNDTESAEILDNYVALLDAPNGTAYSDTYDFKIKNTDAATHSYDITIIAMNSFGDTFVTNNYRMSTDGGSTKLVTVSVTDLAPGAFSGILTLCADSLPAANPGDGYHYFTIKVTETA